MASLRYLGLLLLLTPLLGGVDLLLRQAASEPEVVREVVEVPQPVFVPQRVYVTVAVPTVVVVEVPVESTASSRMVEGPLDDPLDIGRPVESAPVAAQPERLAEAEPVARAEPEARAEPVAEAPPVTLARRAAPAPVRVWTPPPPVEEVAEAPAEAAPPAPAPAPAPVAEAPAPAEEVSGPTFAARQALADFYDYTERNWSVNGYSSAAEMRAALGNSQSDWLRRTEAAARGQ
jgi:hypothetical protein